VVADNTPALLASLDASGRASAAALVNAAREAGIPLIVTSGRRTRAKQAALIRSGVTAAANSRHLYGRAFDVGVIGYQWRQVDPAIWRWLGEAWESIGGRWGGRFRDYDPIHFDW